METFPFLVKPWAHQLEVFNKYRDRPHLAIFWDMGTGKTGEAINFLRYKSYMLERPIRALIVAPNIALDNWARELTAFSKLKGVVLQGDKKKRLERLADKETTIKIINYEGLQSIHKELLRHPWDAMVADESQRAKNIKAQRTKILLALGKQVEIKYILSGTPVLNNPLDIFSQYLFLDGGETFGTSFYAFRNRYFEDKNSRCAGTPYYFPDYKPKPGIVPLLNELIMRKADRRIKSDCLDLPPKIYETVRVKMGDEQAKAYKEMNNMLITFFQEHAVSASAAVIKLLRLNQIASGYVGTEDHEEIAFKANPKLEALKEILEDIATDHKVIIWAVFRQNIKMLAKELAQYNPAVIFGDTLDKTGEQDKFRKDPKCRICIANPQSAGLAINLVEADYAIYFSYNYSLEQRLQSEDRCHRGGSEIHQKITYIDLIAEGSVDEIILKSLKNKEDLAKNIISKISEIL